jgi:hypothetical protein
MPISIIASRGRRRVILALLLLSLVVAPAEVRPGPLTVRPPLPHLPPFAPSLTPLLRPPPTHQAKKNNNRRNQSLDREVKAKRAECEEEMRDDPSCAASAIDMDNCVLRCVSPSCYANVYGSDPLEEGEVDVARGRTFRSCARGELRGAKTAAAERRAVERGVTL